MDQFSRTALLLGRPALQRLRQARVAVFGLGGVGGSAAEVLARSGLGAIDLVDDDKVCLTNLNRQVIATHDTLGQPKVEACRDRLLAIHPELRVTCHPLFYTPETADQIDLSLFDYVIDAIDTVTAKLTLITRATALGVPVVSAMGAGNKLDPTRFEVADIADTSVCPLARVMRRELRKRGIGHLKVVYSREEALTPVPEEVEDTPLSDGPEAEPERGGASRRATPGSVAFVPPVMGMILGGEVVKDIALNRLHCPLVAEGRCPPPCNLSGRSL